MITRLDRLQRRHRGFRQKWFELTPAHVRALCRGLLSTLAAEDGVEAEEIVCFRSVWVAEFQAPLRVGLRPLDLLGDQLRWIQQGDATAFIGIAFAHLAAPVRQAHHPGPLFEDHRLGNLEHRIVLTAETGIDALLSDVAGQFQMLFLVLTNRHQIGVIEKDVRRHQHGIVEQTDGDVVALFDRLLLELDHPLQPVQRGDAVEKPAKLAVGGHLALNEDRAPLWIHSAGEIQGCGAQGVLGELSRVVGNRDRMQINHAHIGVVGVLQIDPVTDRPQPVAQMKGTGWLDTGENPGAWHRSGLGFGGLVGVLVGGLLAGGLLFGGLNGRCFALGFGQGLGLGFRCGLFRLWRLGLGGAGEGIGTGSASTATGALTFKTSTATAAIPSAAIAPATACALGALLLHQFTELTVLKHLAEGAHSEAENRNGGAQVERLLQRPRGAHLVVAQADAETATLSVAAGWSAAPVAPAAPFTTKALAASITLNTLLLLIAAVRIAHGLRPGIRRKCAASSLCCQKPSAASVARDCPLVPAPASEPRPLRLRTWPCSGSADPDSGRWSSHDGRCPD